MEWDEILGLKADKAYSFNDEISISKDIKILCNEAHCSIGYPSDLYSLSVSTDLLRHIAGHLNFKLYL